MIPASTMRASVDCLPASNGKKSSQVKYFRKDEGGFEEERIFYKPTLIKQNAATTSSGNGVRDLEWKNSNSRPETGVYQDDQQHHHHHNRRTENNIGSNNSNNNDILSKHECPADLIPQWGQRKRSKRSENSRSMADESKHENHQEVSVRKIFKAPEKRLIPRPEKQQHHHHHAQIHVHSRTTSLRPLTPLREPSIRNLEDASASGNRGHKRSAEEHSPKRPREKISEKGDHAPAATTGRLPLPDSSHNLPASTPSDTDDGIGIAPVERVDLESFEWPKINLTLSRKEKEEDFLNMKGTKLPQRPKKRPKNVERALQFSTPGNWLPEINRARYEVKEKKSTKKKPRGLKAMESMDSDSD